jgi:chaperonin cofactor prefoldin
VLGGVLVEHNITETKTSLKETVSMLESTLKALDGEMTKRQKEVLDL